MGRCDEVWCEVVMMRCGVLFVVQFIIVFTKVLVE